MKINLTLSKSVFAYVNLKKNVSLWWRRSCLRSSSLGRFRLRSSSWDQISSPIFFLGLISSHCFLPPSLFRLSFSSNSTFRVPFDPSSLLPLFPFSLRWLLRRCVLSCPVLLRGCCDGRRLWGGCYCGCFFASVFRPILFFADVFSWSDWSVNFSDKYFVVFFSFLFFSLFVSSFPSSSFCFGFLFFSYFCEGSEDLWLVVVVVYVVERYLRDPLDLSARSVCWLLFLRPSWFWQRNWGGRGLGILWLYLLVCWFPLAIGGD